MGLLYLFPTQPQEEHFQKVNDQKVRLRTYGLPPIFWLYGLVSLALFGMLLIPVWGPLKQYLSIGEPIDQYIAYSFIALICLAPLTLVSFFFIEKNIFAAPQLIETQWRLFGLPIKTTVFKLNSEHHLSVQHFLDSPNMARIKDEKALKSFQNRGYFELLLNQGTERLAIIDRHSRKADLIKLKEILEQYAQI